MDILNAVERRAAGTSPLRISEVALSVDKGQTQASVARVVREGSVKGLPGRGDLCIVLDTLGVNQLPADQSSALLAQIIRAYYETEGSPSSALRGALLSANAWLFQRNVRADAIHRLLVGIGCAALVAGEAYIAQLGPAVAYAVRADGAERFPADSSWFHAAPPGLIDARRDPLAGSRREVEPALFHTVLAPGDLLIVSTQALMETASTDDIAAAVRDGSATDGIAMLARGRDLVAIVVEHSPQHPSAVEGDVAPVLEPDDTGGRLGNEDALDKDAAAGDDGLSEVPLPWRRSGERQPLGQAVTLPAVPVGNGEAPSATADEPERDAARRDAIDEDASPAVEDGATRELELAGPHPARIAAQEIVRRLRESARRLQRGTENMLLQMLPSEVPERPAVRSGNEDAMPLGGKALVAMVLVIPLMVLFLVVMTRIQYIRVNRAQLVSLHSTAQARCDAAFKLTDQNLQRQGLNDCLEVVEQGLAIIPDDPGLLDQRNRAVHRLDSIDKVERLYYFSRLTSVDDEPASPHDSSRIVTVGKDLLLLSRGSDRVFKFYLSDVGDALQSVEASPILLKKGDAPDGTQVTDLVDIGWFAAGGDRTVAAFAALDRGGTLFTNEAQRVVRAQPVADSGAWLRPVAMGTYAGNLYVLDPLLGRLLKYVPYNNAYTNSPTDYIAPTQNQDLTGAVDMALDGNVYILFADGRIRKFFNGEEKPFALQGLPSAMKGPTSIFVSGPPEPGGNGYVYVVDAGNDRIIQFDKQGIYLRQFRARVDDPYFRDLRGIYVNEAEARLFVFSGNTLWLTSLPKLPAN